MLEVNALSFESVLADDFEAMLIIRIDALRESLERLGRFDPARARARFQEGFVTEHMQHIVYDGVRVGFVTMRPDTEVQALKIDHLYLLPKYQNLGLGAGVMAWAKRQALSQACDIKLSALKHSAANRFYLRHGFVQVGQREFDLDYRWRHREAVVA